MLGIPPYLAPASLNHVQGANCFLKLYQPGMALPIWSVSSSFFSIFPCTTLQAQVQPFPLPYLWKWRSMISKSSYDEIG